MSTFGNDEPRDTLSQGRSPALHGLRARLELLDTGDREHQAMLMGLQALHDFCAEKAKDAKTEHQHAHKHENRAHEIIVNNFPFFLALRTKLRDPGRREKIKGVDSWSEWIDRHFNWCSRRTVYRAFRQVEQRLGLLRGIPAPNRRGKASPYMPNQREIKTLIKSGSLGAQLSQLVLNPDPDLNTMKELAQKYLQIDPSTNLENKYFPERKRDTSDGFSPENYNQTFPFYPALSIHPTMGAMGIWFCRPEQQFTGLFWGAYPRGFLKRAMALFPYVERVLHCPSGTLENLPSGHVTLDLVRDDLRRPLIVGDAHRLPLANESFDLVLCDRPYREKDAEKYGTLMVSMARFMREARRVLRPNGFLGILDLVTFPVCRTSEWRLRGIIGVVPWSNARFRTFSILQKSSDEVASEKTGEQEGCEEPSRSFAILQKIVECQADLKGLTVGGSQTGKVIINNAKTILEYDSRPSVGLATADHAKVLNPPAPDKEEL
jgi:hypothetical protein